MGPSSASGREVGAPLSLVGEDDDVFFWIRRGWIWTDVLVLHGRKEIQSCLICADTVTYGLRHCSGYFPSTNS